MEKPPCNSGKAKALSPDFDPAKLQETARGLRCDIIRMLAEEYCLPVDIVVRTAEVLEEWKDVPASFARQVTREGVVLYAKGEQ